LSEAVQKGTGNIVIKKVSDNSVVETINVTAANVTVSGSTVTVNPTADLAQGTGYYVEIAAGAIKDLAGNNYAGTTGATTWNFTTTVAADTTAPTAATFTPLDNATNIAVAANLVVTLSEAVQKGTGNIVIKKVSDNSVVETINVTSTNVTVSGGKVTINPTADLALGIDYYVEIASGAIQDLAGNNYAGFTGATAWNFNTVPDTTPPTVTSVTSSLTNGIYSVGKVISIAVNFSEAVKYSEEGGHTREPILNLNIGGDSAIYASGSGTNSLIFNYTVKAGQNKTDLDYTSVTALKLNYGTKIKDFTGNDATLTLPIPGTTNSLGGAKDIAIDTDAPGVASFIPAQNATGVGANLVVNFREAIQKGSGNIVISDSFRQRVETIPVTDSNVTVSDTQLTIKPAKLAENSYYYVEIDGGATKDLAGNNFDGISEGIWNFTTGDFTAPTAIFRPANNATDMEVGANLNIYFSEAIKKGSGNIVIRKVSDNSAVENIDVTDYSKVTVKNTVLSINPAKDLDEYTNYYVQIDNGAIKDLSGKNFAGITDATTWKFKTADFTLPTITSFTPADNGDNVALGANLVLKFSEAVNKGGGNIVIKKVSDLSVIENIDVNSAKVTVSGDTVTINPANNLAERTEYSVEIDRGAVRDLAGNDYLGLAALSNTAFALDPSNFNKYSYESYLNTFRASTWNFTTTDPTAPTAISFTPTTNQMNVGVSANLVLNLSEAVRKGTGNIFIKKVSDNSVVEKIDVTSATVTVSGSNVMINPTADLARDTQYYAEIDNGAIKDLAGNNFAGITNATTWKFTTRALAPVQFNLNLTGTGDFIINHTGGVTDPDQYTMNYGGGLFMTESFAKFKGLSGSGLPDNGFFAANADHPEVQLSYNNDNNSGNGKIIYSSPSTFTVTPNKYSEIHLFATSTQGDGSMKVTFNYDDGSSENSTFTVPDWFNRSRTESFSSYNLIGGLGIFNELRGEASTSNNAIFGFGFHPNSNKTLQSFTVTGQSNLTTQVLFGATGTLADSGKLSGRGADGYISGGFVFLDGNLNGVHDENEPFTITNADGSFDLGVDIPQFDANNNSQIDPSEGKIILVDGIDVATSLPLVTPLTSIPGSEMVTPLTTIIASMVQQGLDPATAETQVKSALGLPAGVDLGSYDPLEAIAKGDANGVSVFGSMILVQNTIVQTAKFIEGVSETAVAQLAFSGIGAIANQLKGGAAVDLGKTETILAILQGAITKAGESDPKINPTQLVASAAAAAQIMALGNQIVKDLIASGRPIKDIALEITKLQAVSVGQIAVGLSDLAAGTVTVEQFLAQNSKEAILARMETVKVNDPTVRPVVETIALKDASIDPLAPTSDGITPVTTPVTDTPTSTTAIASGKPTPIPLVTPTPKTTPTPSETPSATTSETPSETPTITSTTNNISNDDCICDRITYPKFNQPNAVENTIIGGAAIQIGTAQNDELLGSNTGNIFDGQSGDDNLYGGADNDIFNGNQGNDFITGGKGEDTLYGDEGNDIILGESGNDLMYGGKGNDLLHDREGTDIIYGNKDDDFMDGGKDNDTLYGGKGNDIMLGSQGDDNLFGQDGTDTICGGEGNDLINGDAGADILGGCAGNDPLYGGADNDTLTGGKGDDLLDGGLGNDSLIGGSGNDIFVLKTGQGFDIIADFTQSQDLIGLSGGLSFGQLEITQNTQGTIIKNLLTGEQLGVMVGLSANAMTSANFMLV